MTFHGDDHQCGSLVRRLFAFGFASIRIWRAAECEVRDVNKTSGLCRGGGAVWVLWEVRWWG
eukprot:7376212-Prymnesium_polylepis.1